MKRIFLFIMIGIIVFLPGCTEDQTAKYLLEREQVSERLPVEDETKDWLIMIYGAVDMKETVLIKAFAKEVNDILKADNPNKNVHIVAQLDFPQKLRDGKRYYIANNKLQVRKKFVNMNTGDPATFEDFIKWAKTYKARKKAIIVMGHGTGWMSVNGPDGIMAGTVAPTRSMDFSYLFNGENNADDRSFGYDDGSDDCISLFEMKNVFQRQFSGKDLDIIAFRSCLMSDIETIYQFAPYTKYVVASQTSQLGMDPMFGQLFGAGLGTSFIKAVNNKTATVEEMTQSICNDICHANKTIIDKMNNLSKDTKFGFQISATDTAKVEDLVNKFAHFTRGMKSLLISDEYRSLKMLQSARRKAIKNGGLLGSLYVNTPDDYEYVDLQTFLQGLDSFTDSVSDSKVQALNRAVRNLRTSLNNTALLSFDNYIDYILIDDDYDSEAHMVKSTIRNSIPRMSITLINKSGKLPDLWRKILSPSYQRLDFDKRTGWSDIIETYCSK